MRRAFWNAAYDARNRAVTMADTQEQGGLWGQSLICD